MYADSINKQQKSFNRELYKNSDLAKTGKIQYFIKRKNMVTNSFYSSSLIKDGLAGIGIEDEGRILSLLEKYIDEIELFNPAYGLVKVKDRRELIVKHVLDSLAPINIIRNLLVTRKQSQIKQPKIADIGTGAGFPGIPLAICMPDSDFILVERMKRRAGFLLNTLAVLGIVNATVEESEMENLAATPSFAGIFDLILFRAWKPLSPVIMNYLFTLLSPCGKIAAYKGRRESIEEEISFLCHSLANSHTQLPYIFETVSVNVPFLDEERHLLLVGKSLK